MHLLTWVKRKFSTQAPDEAYLKVALLAGVLVTDLNASQNQQLQTFEQEPVDPWQALYGEHRKAG